MTESADLLAAIAAAPADDLPRLVFADWLDDRGEPAYAQFIRDQIRLAQVPQWDPLAVRARHQLKDSLGIGRPFFGALPQLPIFLKWHPEKAFRRGFGSGVVVHQLSGLLEAGPQLFDLAPVEELWLSGATLDEWRQLAKSPWLKNVRKLHFHFSQGLHEPIRCLAESKYADNIDEIWFDTLETPAAGLVIEALAQSPLAGQLKGLHLRLVHTPSLPEMIGALAAGEFDKLERFSMVHAGLGPNEILRLNEVSWMNSIREFDVSHNSLSFRHLVFSSRNPILPSLNTVRKLCVDNCSISGEVFLDNILAYKLLPSTLPSLSIANNDLKSTGFHYIVSTDYFQSITCLIMRNNRLTNSDIYALFELPFISHIAELDWTENDLTRGYRALLSNQAIRNITALRLDKLTLPKIAIPRLESHFGDRLVWAADDAPTGLAR